MMSGRLSPVRSPAADPRKPDREVGRYAVRSLERFPPEIPNTERRWLPPFATAAQQLKQSIVQGQLPRCQQVEELRGVRRNSPSRQRARSQTGKGGVEDLLLGGTKQLGRGRVQDLLGTGYPVGRLRDRG